MKCGKCGEKMHPIDTLESPITGEMVATGYECPNQCELIEWLESKVNNRKVR